MVEADLSQARQEAAVLEAMRAELEASADRLQRELAQASAQRAELADRTSRAEERAEEAERASRDALDARANVERELGALEVNLMHLGQRHELDDATRAALEARADALAAGVEGTAEAIEALARRAGEAEQRAAELEGGAVEAGGWASGLLARIDAADRQAAQLARSLEERETVAALRLHFEARATELETGIATAMETAASLDARADAAERLAGNLSASTEAEVAHVEAVGRRAEEAARRLEEMEARLRDAESVRNELTEVIAARKELAQSLQEAQERIDALDQQVERAARVDDEAAERVAAAEHLAQVNLEERSWVERRLAELEPQLARMSAVEAEQEATIRRLRTRLEELESVAAIADSPEPAAAIPDSAESDAIDADPDVMRLRETERNAQERVTALTGELDESSDGASEWARPHLDWLRQELARAEAERDEARAKIRRRVASHDTVPGDNGGRE
jgi:chromosome segregation ATPase